MFRFLCKKPFQSNGDSTTLQCFLQNPYLIKHICSFSTNHNSLTVSYLINTCGLSEEKAISAAKQLHFETTTRPDSVLSLLRNYGFTKTHISKLVAMNPSLLLADPNTTLEPKFKFFHSLGFSNLDLANVLSKDSSVLKRSLENQIIPTIDFLKSIVHSDRNVVAVLKRSTWVFLKNQHKQMEPNIAILRDVGVSDSNISMLLISQPRAFLQNANKFSKIVNQIKEMGFNPLAGMFVIAIHALTSMSKSTWEAKMEVYRKWGWSKDEIMMAFKKQPFCMIASEKKITSIMDVLVNKMGYDPSDIAKRPVCLMLSLEKRIIPRCSVIQVLISKGLVEKNRRTTTMLTMVEDDFLKKFVTKYGEILPELLMAYQGKNNVLELPIRTD